MADLLSPLAQTPAALAELREVQEQSDLAIQAGIQHQTEDPGAALPVPFTQVCDVMIDLYDRWQRSLQTCDEGIELLVDRRNTGWMRRLGLSRDVSAQAIASVQAIREAAALTLARLQAALQDWGIQRIGRAGEPFDPDRMTVVETRATDQAEPGTVLIVNRSGYALNGMLKTAAQVTVSKSEV